MVKKKTRYIPPASPDNPLYQGPPQISTHCCYVCRLVGHVPEWTVGNGWGLFGICSDCVKIIKHQLEIETNVRRELYRMDTRSIFRYTLGADLTPREIKFIWIPNYQI